MNQKLRSLYEGLKTVLDGDDLWHALCIWQDQYADTPTYALNDYLKTITPLLPESASRPDLHRQLVSSLMLNGKVAYFDPIPQMNDFRVRHGLVVPEAEPEMEVPEHLQSFHNFIANLLSALNNRQQDQLKGALMQESKRRDVDPTFKDYLASLYLNQPELSGVEVQASALTWFLNRSYESLCVLLGPVEADRLFENALRQNQQSIHGQAFELEALL